MNILVCVKYVPDATADRHFEDDYTVDRVGVDGLLSELDEYAMEQALQLKEKAGEGEVEVTALCVGPEKAVDAVRKALQMGADKAIHVLDDAIAGSDAIATSLVLAKAVEKAGADAPVDMVVCGMASTDGSMSVVPAMLAERLSWPQVTMASVVESQGDQVRIKRDGDTATEVIGATMPLVLRLFATPSDKRHGVSFQRDFKAFFRHSRHFGLKNVTINRLVNVHVGCHEGPFVQNDAVVFPLGLFLSNCIHNCSPLHVAGRCRKGCLPAFLVS